MRPDVVRREAARLRGERKSALAQAASDAERKLRKISGDLAMLTSSELWNKYLSLVLDLQRPDVAALADLEERGRQGEFETAEESARRHFEVSILRERIRAREECIDIPKALLAGTPGAQEQSEPQ